MDRPNFFNKHLLMASSMPGPARGCFLSFNTHNTLGGCSSGPRPPERTGRSQRRWGCPWQFSSMASGLMLLPEAHLGLGIASEMLVEPLAQVPLLRSSQRDPSIQDIIWVTTGWI